MNFNFFKPQPKTPEPEPKREDSGMDSPTLFPDQPTPTDADGNSPSTSEPDRPSPPETDGAGHVPNPSDSDGHHPPTTDEVRLRPPETDVDRRDPTPSEPDRLRPAEPETVRREPTIAHEVTDEPTVQETGGSRQSETERTESHTITVREAVKRFEQANVPRTERSITRWCHPNRQGIARLDGYFDDNENRYYLTPESVDRAIEEEKAKDRRSGSPHGQPSADGHANNPSPDGLNEPPTSTAGSGTGRASSDSAPVRELEAKLRDAEITSRAKDYYIEKLESERIHMIERIETTSQRIGQLETRLQLGGGEGRRGDGEFDSRRSA